MASGAVCLRSSGGVAMVIASAALSVLPASAQSQPWELFVNQEVRYFSWSGTRGYPAAGIATTARGSGWQLYAPVTVQLAGIPVENLKFELIGRGGYVESKQTTPGASGSVSTTTDTVAAATWTYFGIPGIQPFLSLSANLPSGKSVLLGAATFARMDPDLVDIASFGEGWNIGPTLGINFAVAENAIFSVGAGYTWRGKYDREFLPPVPPTATAELDPADVVTINASLGFRQGALSGQIAGSYSHEGKTSLTGMPFFQLGDRYFVSGVASYAWSEASVSSLVASWNYSQKNKVLIPPLTLEGFNSNSNLYRVRLEHAFVFGSWSLGPVGSWLFRDENSYSPTAFQFVPAKTRWSAGGNLRYSVNKNALLYASVEHVWIDENERIPAIGTPVPDSSYTGWVAVGGGTFRF